MLVVYGIFLCFLLGNLLFVCRYMVNIYYIVSIHALLLYLNALFTIFGRCLNSIFVMWCQNMCRMSLMMFLFRRIFYFHSHIFVAVSNYLKSTGVLSLSLKIEIKVGQVFFSRKCMKKIDQEFRFGYNHNNNHYLVCIETKFAYLVF